MTKTERCGDATMRPEPTAPDYFVIKCFDLIGEFDEEIEHLEVVNETLVNSVKSM